MAKTVIMAMILMLILSGSVQAQTPVAFAGLIDSTTTARGNRVQGIKNLKQIIKCLPQGSHIAIIAVNEQPSIVWEGSKISVTEIIGAVDRATVTGANNGTDTFGALELARHWFLAPLQTPFAKKMAVGWLDCRNEHSIMGHRVKRFKPASDFLWPGVNNVKVFFVGVAPDLQFTIDKKWTPHLTSRPVLVGPGYHIRPSDLDLEEQGFFG